MTAGIAIDPYKKETFLKNLANAKFEVISSDTKNIGEQKMCVIKVKYNKDTFDKLTEVVNKSNAQSQSLKQ